MIPIAAIVSVAEAVRALFTFLATAEGQEVCKSIREGHIKWEKALADGLNALKSCRQID
jgi:hypothetical protein